MQYQLQTQPTLVNALKLQIQTAISQAVNSTASFLSKTISIVTENSTIPDKYNSLAMNYQTFIYGNFGDFESAIQDRINGATSIANQMCATPSQYIDG